MKTLLWVLCELLGLAPGWRFRTSLEESRRYCRFTAGHAGPCVSEYDWQLP